MTILFENDNDIIVYALEKLFSDAQNSLQIFVAQCVWWLPWIIGLEEGLVNHIDNIRSKSEVAIIPERVQDSMDTVSSVPKDVQEDEKCDQVLEES
jgi:hypothetical protein